MPVEPWKGFDEMKNAILGQYKGHPTIELEMAGEDRGFTFGVKKARAILDNLEAIRGFVESGGKGLRPSATHNGGSGQDVPALRADDTVIPVPIWMRATTPANGVSVHKDRTPGPNQGPNGVPAGKAIVALANSLPSEDSLREEPACRGCGKDKTGQGLLVCWDCFKRHPLCPLQTSGVTVNQWMARYAQYNGKGGKL